MIKHLKKSVLLLLLLLSFKTYSTTYSRDGFTIIINAQNQLRAEGENCKIEDLSSALYRYFTANMYTESDEYGVARFRNYYKSNTIERIQILENSKTDYYGVNNLKQLKRKIYVMDFLNIKALRVLHPTEVVRIKMKSKTSYKTYIAVLSEIKKNTNRIRNQIAKKLFNLSYRKIIVNQKSKLMRQYLLVLKVLVPERIIETPIKN